MNVSLNEQNKRIPQSLFNQENDHTFDKLKLNNEETFYVNKSINEIKDNPKSERLIMMKAEMTMKLTGNIRQLQYKGPRDKIIQDLCEDVLIMEGIKDHNSPFNLFLTKLKHYNEHINQWFTRNCTFFGGLIILDKDTLLLWITNIIIQLVFYILYLNVNFTSNDDTKKTIHDFLPTFSWVFTFYGLILLLIKTKPMIIIIAIQIIIPVFLILNDLNILIEGSNNVYSTSSLIIKISVIILAAFWAMIYAMHRAILLFNRFYGNLSAMLICGIFCFWMLGITLLTYLGNNSLSLSQSYIQQNADNFLIFIYILIVFSWLIIHFRYFRVPFQEMRTVIENHGNHLIRKGVVNTDFINNNNNNNTSELVQYLSKYMYFFSSILIGGTYIGIEIYLTNILYNAIFDSNSKLILTIAFAELAIPIFLFSWISFVMSTFHKKNKYLIIPLLISMMLFILIPIAQKIQAYDNNNTWLVEYIIYGPPVTVLFAMIFLTCGMKLRRKFYIWSTIICLGALFPIGICYFLIQTSYLDTTKNIILYSMMAFSMAIALLIFLPFLMEYFRSCARKVSSLKNNSSARVHSQNENNEPIDELANNDDHEVKKKIKKKLDFMENFFSKISNMNLKDIAYFMNTLLFMISFFCYLYIGYNRPSSIINSRLGMILGLVIIMPIIFTMNNIFIRLKTSKISEDQEYTLSNLILQAVIQNQDINIKRLNFITKFQKVLMLIGMIVIPAVFLPLIFIFDNDILRSCFMVILVIGFIFSLLSIIILEVKKISRKIHKAVIPLLVLLFWFWLYIPFLVLFPIISCYLDTKSNQFKYFLSSSMSAAAISFMLGVTLLGAAIVSFLKRMELERKMVFILEFVKNKLAEYSIYSETKELRILYLDYIEKDHTVLKKLLIQDHKPVTWFTLPNDSNRYTGYHKFICTYEIKRALIKAQAKKNAAIKKKSSCCNKAWDWLFESPKQQDMPVLRENIEDFDDFIMDIYMPDDMGENYLLPNNILELLGLKKDKFLKTQEENTGKVKAIDENLTDHMTEILKRLKIYKPKQLKHYENIHHDYLLLIKKDQKAYEDWIFVLYEYFTGKFGKYNRDDSPNHGMIFQNFQLFLNLATLSPNPKLTSEFIKCTYIDNANQKYNDHYVLSFQDFKKILIFYSEILYVNDTSTRPQNDYNNIDFKDETPFEELTTQIYISLMTNVPDIVNTHLIYNLNALNRYGASSESKLYDKDNLQEVDLDLQSTPIRINNSVVGNTLKVELAYNHAFVVTFSQDHFDINGHEEGYAKSSNRVLSTLSKKNEEKGQSVSDKEKVFLTNTKNQTQKIGYFDRFLNWINSSIRKSLVFLGFLKENPSNPYSDAAFRKVAPSWPTVVDIMFNSIKEAEKLYEELDIIEQKLIVNLESILQLWTRISDTFTFISPAFRNQIPWLYEWYGDSSLTIESETSSIAWYKSFTMLFWIGFSLSLIYPFLAFPSFNLAKKGKLGYDEASSAVAKFPHKQFLLVNLVNIVGSLLFNQIIQWQIIAFPCDFTSYPWTMLQEKTIMCLSDEHAFYIILALLGLIIYYPISTFMFPILSYESKGKTWKYDGSFLVLCVQFTTYFFAGENSYDVSTILIQLGSTIFLMVLFTIITFTTSPCMIKKINNMDALSYMIAAWANICGAVMVTTRNSILSIILLAIGTLVLIFIIYKIHVRQYSFNSIKPTKQDYLVYDKAKERAENPFYMEELAREKQIKEGDMEEVKKDSIFHEI